MSVQLSMPYIVSLEADAVEIHDAVSLSSLQRVRLATNTAQASPITNATCMGFSELSGDKSYFYLFSADHVNVFKMVPIFSQIRTLVGSGLFQEALDIYAVCRSPKLDAELASCDLYATEIHSQFAQALHTQGDFEGSVKNFISARTKAADVIALFPDFISATLYAAFSSCTGEITLPPRTTSNTRLSGTVLHRAAAALALFCEYHRPRLRAYIDRLEAVEVTAPLRSSTRPLSSAAAAASADEDDGYSENSTSSDGGRKPSAKTSSNMSLQEAQAVAVLVDTVYLSALVNCSPARRGAVLDLLTELPPEPPRTTRPSAIHSISSTAASNSRRKAVGSIGYNKEYGNQCHVESCAVVLASQGSAFTEPLLWLYRSHGEHKKALGYLTVDRCVSSGSAGKASVGWSIHHFYGWTADYLRWLWFSEGNSASTTLAPLVLPSLKQVLEFDADLGLSVLICRPMGSTGSGGRGVSVREIISYLETISPGPSKHSLLSIAAMAEEYAADGKINTARLLPIPPINGRSLGIAYLEWVIYEVGGVPQAVQDEFVQLLIESIPMQLETDHSANYLSLLQTDEDPIISYKLFRQKLQDFLRSPQSDFSTEKIMKVIPKELLHEYALILSKMGRHDETLRIYCHQLADLASAEEYCHRLFDQGVENVYMKMITTLLSPPEHSKLMMDVPLSPSSVTPEGTTAGTGSASRLVQLSVTIAERNYDRVNSSEFIQALPKNIPISMLSKYLNIIIEMGNAKKRNLQIVHQLLRMREVNIRTEEK